MTNTNTTSTNDLPNLAVFAESPPHEPKGRAHRRPPFAAPCSRRQAMFHVKHPSPYPPRKTLSPLLAIRSESRRLDFPKIHAWPGEGCHAADAADEGLTRFGSSWRKIWIILAEEHRHAATCAK